MTIYLANMALIHVRVMSFSLYIYEGIHKIVDATDQRGATGPSPKISVLYRGNWQAKPVGSSEFNGSGQLNTPPCYVRSTSAINHTSTLHTKLQDHVWPCCLRTRYATHDMNAWWQRITRSPSDRRRKKHSKNSRIWYELKPNDG